MKHWNSEIDEITARGYDPEVVEGIRALTDLLDNDSELAAVMDDLVYRYAVAETLAMRHALAEIQNIAEKFNQNEYSLDLLLLLGGLPHLHKKYRDNGISDEIFYATMDDIRCKVNECVENKGVVGTFVAYWFDGYFKLTRFAYGRFQYEVADYEEIPLNMRPSNGEGFKLSCGKTLKPGGRFINIHIPANGVPLTDEVRVSSYREAYPHFAHLFDDGIVLFGCHSWLLYPKHREFLPPHLNLLKFMGDFEIVAYDESLEKFSDKWRVFGRHQNLPNDQLPKDTALRRAYAEWLQAGNPVGQGLGLFAFDGNEFVK